LHAWPSPTPQAAELASWQAALGAGAAGKQQQGQQQAYSRLASEQEVAPLVAQAAELLAPKKEEDPCKLRGRTMQFCFIAKCMHQ
jgi:hypothetical protein